MIKVTDGFYSLSSNFVIDTRDLLAWVEFNTDLEDEDAEQCSIVISLLDDIGIQSSRNGITLIHENYFEDYVQEWYSEVYGDDLINAPGLEIDWVKTTKNFRQDYTSIDFDGITFWYRPE